MWLVALMGPSTMLGHPVQFFSPFVQGFWIILWHGRRSFGMDVF